MKASDLLEMLDRCAVGPDGRLTLEIVVAVLRHVRRSGSDLLVVDLTEDELLDFLRHSKK